MRTDQFDYHLPPDLIAQTPLPRGQSRLLVLHRNTGTIEHRDFPSLLEYLKPDDLLVLNDTRVTAKRLQAERSGGEPAEVLLLRPLQGRRWEALVRPGKALKPGRTLRIKSPSAHVPDVLATVVATTADGGRILEFDSSELRDKIVDWGATPLPPYIRSPLPIDQAERYQTIYARTAGSAAAPTAGLHFTAEILDKAAQIGVNRAFVTLDIGIDTFRPVRTEEIESHAMHGENVMVSAQTAHMVNTASGRIIAVGTTVVRSLEAAAHCVPQAPPSDQKVAPYCGETRLFISPGYRFQVVDVMLTNFHLPKSTLLMLVSAFAGHTAIMRAYAEAVRLKYRFYSFGDAMLIV